MSKERLARLGRRIVVLAATVAVIGVAVGVVQVAAQWRAEAAPLDTAPVGMSEISDDFAIEAERAADLADQMDGVAGQISGLQAALITANGSIDDDTQAATELQGQLAAAKAEAHRPREAAQGGPGAPGAAEQGRGPPGRPQPCSGRPEQR